MTNWHIIPATATEDFTAIQQLYYTTWQATYHHMLPAAYLATLTPATWQPAKRWRNTLLAKDVNGTILGVCAYGPARDPKRAGWGELYSIYVLPAEQGQGIGAALLRAAFTILRPQFSKLYLNVLAENTHAQHVYRHFGFHNSGPALKTVIAGGLLTEQKMVSDSASKKEEPYNH